MPPPHLSQVISSLGEVWREEAATWLFFLPFSQKNDLQLWGFSFSSKQVVTQMVLGIAAVRSQSKDNSIVQVYLHFPTCQSFVT